MACAVHGPSLGKRSPGLQPESHGVARAGGQLGGPGRSALPIHLVRPTKHHGAVTRSR